MPHKLNNSGLEKKHVVTCFLEHAGKILILKRSRKVGTYQGSWAGVSGYMEASAMKQAFIEIKEETGLTRSDIKLITKGKSLEITDERLNRKWIIHPFLFYVKDPKNIKIDWEHTEMKWITPEELTIYQTVPALKETLERVIGNNLK